MSMYFFKSSPEDIFTNLEGMERGGGLAGRKRKREGERETLM